MKRWKDERHSDERIYEYLNLFQDLGSNKSTTMKILAELREKLWIQRGTRAVFYDFTVYNANINLFCVIKWGNGHCTRSLPLCTLIKKYQTPFLSVTVQPIPLCLCFFKSCSIDWKMFDNIFDDCTWLVNFSP